MTDLVRLKTRPSRDGKSFKYFVDYKGENGKRRRISLGHADRRKAEKQRAQLEREIRVGAVKPESMSLRELTKDRLRKTGKQIRESTQHEYLSAMKDFIKVVGNIDYQKVTVELGEFYRRRCLDKGNTPATVAKKIRHLRRLFQLAVKRRQLDENPFAYVEKPRSPKQKVNTYASEECARIIQAAKELSDEWNSETNLKWDLLILAALTTAMRRGELLNCTWDDVDFEKQTIEVSPKQDTDTTWAWKIKDCERRTLPLTEEILDMLAEHQSRQPYGQPYVFVPKARYKYIQEKLRPAGNWSLSDSRLRVVNNFSKKFKKILRKAHVKNGQFHDLRKTALSNWFANGMSEYDVMALAGHSNFSTTHKFYLAVADDLVDRARAAAQENVRKDLAHIWHAPPFSSTTEKSSIRK